MHFSCVVMLRRTIKSLFLISIEMIMCDSKLLQIRSFSYFSLMISSLMCDSK